MLPPVPAKAFPGKVLCSLCHNIEIVFWKSWQNCQNVRQAHLQVIPVTISLYLTGRAVSICSFQISLNPQQSSIQLLHLLFRNLAALEHLGHDPGILQLGIHFLKRIRPDLLLLNAFHDFFGFLGIVPETGSLGLGFLLVYEFFLPGDVKDTSSASPPSQTTLQACFYRTFIFDLCSKFPKCVPPPWRCVITGNPASPNPSVPAIPKQRKRFAWRETKLQIYKEKTRSGSYLLHQATSFALPVGLCYLRYRLYQSLRPRRKDVFSSGLP